MPQEPAGATFCAREIDPTTDSSDRHATRDARVTVMTIAEVGYNIRSSVGWLSEDHTVCTEVCDAQEPARSTFVGC